MSYSISLEEIMALVMMHDRWMVVLKRHTNVEKDISREDSCRLEIINYPVNTVVRVKCYSLCLKTSLESYHFP